MYLHYRKNTEEFELFQKKSEHIRPHLHKMLECVFVTQGSLELGIGTELYHMEEGDLGIVFPDLIHHYQSFNFTEEGGFAYYLLAPPSLWTPFQQILQFKTPKCPVIPCEKLHRDVDYFITNLIRDHIENKEENLIADFSRDKLNLVQAYMTIFLTRCLPLLDLEMRKKETSQDIVERVITYIASHFTEPDLTLNRMSKEMYVSPGTLSRTFSGVFHMNFNAYLNSVRLDYACFLLRTSDQTVTEIYENAGFNSQRTFNRVFKEVYHLSPKEYRLQSV